MTTLTQLIEHYCPDGVEYVKLEDVIELNPGTRITKARNTGTMFPVYGGGGVSFYTDDSNRSDEWVISRFAMSPHCFRYVSGKFWLLDSGITFAVRGEQSKQYIAHFLSSIQPLIYATSSKSAQRNLRVKDFLKLELPLPSREVQDAIVERLDAFAALIESLDSEITLRENRFEYFREQLLTFDESDGVECVKLGGAAEIITGKTPKTSEPALWGGSTPFVTPTDFANGYDSHGRTARSVSDQALQAAKNKIVAPGATLVTCIGASLGGVAFATEQCLTNQQINAVVPSEKLTPRFIYYVMQESADYLRSLGGSGTMPIVNKAKFSEFTLPLPSLEVQQDIADKLDTMQALIDNLKQERELRKSQFEYYREKLLTFNS